MLFLQQYHDKEMIELFSLLNPVNFIHFLPRISTWVLLLDLIKNFLKNLIFHFICPSHDHSFH